MKGWRFREFQAELIPPIHTGISMPFIAYQAILFTHPPGRVATGSIPRRIFALKLAANLKI
jgi:hypothetical protein